MNQDTHNHPNHNKDTESEHKNDGTHGTQHDHESQQGQKKHPDITGNQNTENGESENMDQDINETEGIKE